VAAIPPSPCAFHSSEWASTAIFITWDDCGCFYDHVDPWQYSRSWGVRVPTHIGSPYARAGYTDHHVATFASLLTFIERTFSLKALRPCDSVGAADPRSTDDAVGPHGTATYGYHAAFDYSQHPIAPLAPVYTELPASQRRWIRHHRGIGEEAT
jgi:phospholipase C